ncbi:cytoplasmic dynein 2 intermediate chain 2-like [Oppia nitens]|uniref:cytoplasmic dynein 2 intermediate chain 2-like n=1 Tax=Oppia nitens TaxID=1686743 RepID=UPI0023DB26CC|nr:cytoplasmic dynein 2 intermediate chain 2-like [Oppia nitens]
MSFSETHFDGINIPSVWRKSMISSETSTQTQSIDCVDSEVQHNLLKDTETQTTNLDDIQRNRPLKTFNKFQNRTKIKANLNKKFGFRALDSIVTKNDFQYNVSALCWNCNASVLAIGHQVNHHSDWCTHESYILLWNLFKATETEEPSLQFDLDGCVSVLVSHPTLPSVYCSGSLNGKISLWNIRNKENEFLFASVVAHQQQVSGIHWCQPNNTTDLGQIISCGFDGKVFVWKVHEKSIQLEKAFALTAQDMPRNIQIKGNKSNVEVPIVSMSFNCEDSNIFIIGCIGGPIFQCSLNSNKPVNNDFSTGINSKYKNIEYKNPIVMSYAIHRSHINSVQFSPVSRNIFFSCSSDSELRIYNLLQTVPIIVIHTDVPLLTGQWSPYSANIASVGSDGNVYIYTINYTTISNASFSFSIGDNVLAKSLVYNTIDNIEQIAVIGSNNSIYVWDLLLSSEKSDGKHMNDILRRMTDTIDD